MEVKIPFILIFCFNNIECDRSSDEDPKPVNFTQEKPHNPKYDNPGYIRDRERDMESTAFSSLDAEGKEIHGVVRPSIMGDAWNNRFKARWHPAWMDYCDPYHCNDYHKPACGLNRDSMKFKWFQSGCHITLHNFCSTYKGAIRYDTINPLFCVKYRMIMRSDTQCDQECSNEMEPVCGSSNVDNHVVLFKNQCWMNSANCRRKFYDEYEPVGLDICEFTFVFNNMKRLAHLGKKH